MSDRDVRVIEVGPRDGLQNTADTVPTDMKLRYISLLIHAGVTQLEVTSFVSPKWVPQLADSELVWEGLSDLKASPNVNFSALVPNEVGLNKALRLGAKEIALFTSASETFTRKNINCTISESLDRFKDLIKQFRAEGGKFVRGYVSTAFSCPFEGKISPILVRQVAEVLIEIGVDEVSMGDTIGSAIPSEVQALGEELLTVIPLKKINFHFHDTWGTAIANVSKALELGFRSFDGSAGGIGGCPFAPGAGGNIATDDLVHFLHREGFSTGIDERRLAKASLEVLKFLGELPSPKVSDRKLSKAQEAIISQMELNEI